MQKRVEAAKSNTEPKLSAADRKIRFYNWALGLLLLAFGLFKAYALLAPKYFN